MESITLKEIAGYLPYKLQVLVKNNVVELYELHNKNSISTYPKIRGFKYVQYEDFKPLLYPLSMLTQEIECNGEKFVPLYKLQSIDRGFCASDLDVFGVEMVKYGIIELLYEWHFDIFRMIERGFAIDKSKI